MDRIHKFFFSLLLVFLPTQLGYHVWPAWAMVLGRRIDYLAPTLYFTDILIFLVLFFWLFEWFVILGSSPGIQLKKRLDSRLRGNDKLIISALLLCFILINIFIAENRNVALYKWLKMLEFAGLGYYIVKTKVQLSAISYQLSAGILYSSLIAIAQFFFQHSIGGPFWLLGERTFTVDTPGIARALACKFSIFNFQFSMSHCREVLRAYATFPHPNVLGGYLAVILPLVISNFQFPISNQKKKFSIFKIITIVAGVIALVLTFSRSAMAVGVIAVALVIARIRNYELKIMRSSRMMAVVFFGIAALLFASYFIIHDSTEESIVVRVALNDAAIRIWKNSPWIGVGLGNFLVELPKALPSRSVYFLQPVHNIYLLVLAETGSIGLLLFLGILWKVTKNDLRFMIYEVRRKQQGKTFIIYISLFIVLLLGLVDHYPLTLQQGQLLATLLLSLSVVYTRGHDRQ